MPTIDLECPNCSTPFKVDGSFAGRRGTCKTCGQKIAIPGLGASTLRSVSTPLAKATPEQMLAELARRKVSAVLAYSDPGPTQPAEPDTGGDLLDSGVDFRRLLYCHKTPDLETQHVGRMLEHVAKHVRREQASKSIAEKTELFELKGDWLGMSLDEFKRKYHRELPALGRTMPWCSDETPGTAIPALNAEQWYSSAGIVCARTDLPAEGASPTIANERTESVIYQFLDGHLFQIEAYFATQTFHRVLEVLNRKYGEPIAESHSPRQVTWWNLSATIELKFGSIRPPRSSRLRFFHDELYQQAVERVPSHTHDI